MANYKIIFEYKDKKYQSIQENMVDAETAKYFFYGEAYRKKLDNTKIKIISCEEIGNGNNRNSIFDMLNDITKGKK